MKLLLTIIQKHCPKAPTKDINISGRSALGVQRRFEGLRKAHPLDDSGNITGFSALGAPKAAGNDTGPETDDEPASPVVKKRKAPTEKKTAVKKVKKEVKPKLEDGEDEDAKAAFDDEEVLI